MKRWILAYLWGVSVATLALGAQVLSDATSSSRADGCLLRSALELAAISTLGVVCTLVLPKFSRLALVLIASAAFGLSVLSLRSITFILDAGPHNGDPLPLNNVINPALCIWLDTLGTFSMAALLWRRGSWLRITVRVVPTYVAWTFMVGLATYASLSQDALRDASPLVGLLSAAIESHSLKPLLILCYGGLVPSYWAPIVAANVPMQ